MTALDPKAIVRRLVDDDLSVADATLRHQAANEIISAGFVDHTNPPALKYGIESHKALVDIFHTAFTDLQWALEDMFAEDDKVCMRLTMRGVHTGDFFGIPATGRRVEVGGTHVVRIAEDRVAEHWGNNDDLFLMRQLGVVPDPDSVPA
jgi:predicted ester cyclase